MVIRSYLLGNLLVNVAVEPGVLEDLAEAVENIASARRRLLRVVNGAKEFQDLS